MCVSADYCPQMTWIDTELMRAPSASDCRLLTVAASVTAAAPTRAPRQWPALDELASIIVSFNGLASLLQESRDPSESKACRSCLKMRALSLGLATLLL